MEKWLRNHQIVAINGKESCRKDWSNKENIIFLIKARKGFKNQENIKGKREAGNIRKNGRFSAKTEQGNNKSSASQYQSVCLLKAGVHLKAVLTSP